MRIIVSGVGDYRYVDCVAIRAGKQEALEYTRALFNVPLSRCMAAGDSGNDILMLEGTQTHPATALLPMLILTPALEAWQYVPAPKSMSYIYTVFMLCR